MVSVLNWLFCRKVFFFFFCLTLCFWYIYCCSYCPVTSVPSLKCFYLLCNFYMLVFFCLLLLVSKESNKDKKWEGAPKKKKKQSTPSLFTFLNTLCICLKRQQQTNTKGKLNVKKNTFLQIKTMMPDCLLRKTILMLKNLHNMK